MLFYPLCPRFSVVLSEGTRMYIYSILSEVDIFTAFLFYMVFWCIECFPHPLFLPNLPPISCLLSAPSQSGPSRAPLLSLSLDTVSPPLAPPSPSLFSFMGSLLYLVSSVHIAQSRIKTAVPESQSEKQSRLSIFCFALEIGI